MALTQDQKNRIHEVIKEILLRRIKNFPEVGAEIRNAPFHSAFLNHCALKAHRFSGRAKAL